MDKLAEMGVTGRMKTVADGFHPGSEVANMAVLGYDLPTVYEGRGVLEAASIGYDLKPGEMAMRCNLICVEGDILKNHSSGHITTEEADELIRFLNEKLGSDHIHFYTGVSYRHLLIVKGGDKRLDCTCLLYTSVIVVVSALGGITDKLLKTASMATNGDVAYEREFSEIVARHLDVIQGVIPDKSLMRYTPL